MAGGIEGAWCEGGNDNGEREVDWSGEWKIKTEEKEQEGVTNTKDI